MSEEKDMEPVFVPKGKKWKWVKASRRRQMKLADWVVEALEEKAKLEMPDLVERERKDYEGPK
jgi:hypothetical protein